MPPPALSLRAVPAAAQKTGSRLKPAMVDNSVTILRYSVSVGRLGLGGISGTGGLLQFPATVDFRRKYPHIIAASAPSMVEIRNTQSIALVGFVEQRKEPVQRVSFCADGNLVGHVADFTQTTADDGEEFLLLPGDHLLEVIITNRQQNSTAAAVWSYRIVKP